MNKESKNWQELIPLYLNGQLPNDLKKEFESRLKQDEKLNREYQEFADIKRSYSKIPPDMFEPPEDAFKKIMEKIGATKKAVSSGKPVFSATFLIEKIYSYFKLSRLAWSVAALQMAVILVMVFAPTIDHDFKTLSSRDLHPVSREGARINVVFKADAMEQDIRSLLTDLGVSIVGGPSKNGLYILLIEDANRADSILASLKKAPQVRLAQARFE